MEGSGDSFEYLLQLTKTLSSYAWNTRQETEKVEQSLKRLAKQNHISYKDYCKEPTNTTLEKFGKLKTKSEDDRLIDENYQLIYQIQQQEYINGKICLLTHQIDEMMLSIRNFIVEQKAISPKIEEAFISKNLNEHLSVLQNSLDDSKGIRTNSQDKLDIIIGDLISLCKNIPWDSFRKSDQNVTKVLKQIKSFEDSYNLKLLPKLPDHLDRCFRN